MEEAKRPETVEPANEAGARLRGDYLGRTRPGTAAAIFDDGQITGDSRLFNLSFSPEDNELFFSYNKATPERPEPRYEIRTMKRVEDTWHGPEVASFSGTHSDVDITFSPDGTKLFFASERPHSKSAGMDIYYLERQEDGWSQPIHAGPEVNSMAGEVHAVLSSRGNLFFRSGREGGYGHADLYKAEWSDGTFRNVTNLGPEVNTEYMESDCFVAPDESFILFNTIRPEHDMKPQIYVSFRVSADRWSKGRSLGESVNSPDGTQGSTLSPDGKYLFYKSGQGEHRAVYWISSEVITRLRPNSSSPPAP